MKIKKILAIIIVSVFCISSYTKVFAYNGKHMDFLSGDAIVGNSIYIIAYTMNDRVWQDLME